MRKTLLLLAAISIVSCSNDDGEINCNCENVYGDPEQPNSEIPVRVKECEIAKYGEIYYLTVDGENRKYVGERGFKYLNQLSFEMGCQK